MRTRITGRLAAALALCVLPLSPTLAGPKVVTSIAPLYALAAQVMAGEGEPALLIPGAADPHDFQLRPSQAKAIAEADLVLWIGPTLEAGLARPLKALAREGAALALADATGVTILPARTGELFGHGHEGGGAADPHLWLDPDNARAILSILARELSRLHPERARLYADNAFASDNRIAALGDALALRLAPLAGRRYVVQHDALQYFERRFGLSPLGAISPSPDAQPGAARLLSLTRAIVESQARCIFVQPQAAPGIARALSRSSGARVATLDDLGASIPLGPDAYDQLLENIADALIGCLR